MKYFTGKETVDELKTSYRRLSMRLHPDAGGKHEDFVAMKAEYDQLCKGKVKVVISFDNPYAQQRHWQYEQTEYQRRAEARGNKRRTAGWRWQDPASTQQQELNREHIIFQMKLGDLVDLAKAKGYKTGWVCYKMKDLKKDLTIRDFLYLAQITGENSSWAAYWYNKICG